MRTYTLLLRKPAEGSVPKVRLVLSAPAADFTVRRTRWASRDLMKQALRQPREVKPKKVKNVTTSGLGETLGQIHMERQDYTQLQTRKIKALNPNKAIPLAKPAPVEERDDEDS